MAGQNTSTIDVLIKSQLDTSRAISDLKRLTEEAKGQATLINKAFESSFSKKGSLKSSVFIDMISAIKQVEAAVKSLPKAMSNSFSSLERSASKAKDAVDSAAKSMDKVAGKKAKATVDIEIRSPKDIQKVVGEALSKGNFSVGHAQEWVKGVASASGVSLSDSQQAKIVKSLTKKYNLDTSSNVVPGANLDRIKADLEAQAKDDADRTARNKALQKEINKKRAEAARLELRLLDAKIKMIQKEEKLQQEWRMQAGKDARSGLYGGKSLVNVDPATKSAKESMSAFFPEAAKTYTSKDVSMLPKEYFRWKQGDFKSGDAFINDAKRYVKYAVNDLGMSITDAMKNVSKSTAAQKLSKDRPAGEYAGRLLGNKSDFEKAMRDVAGSITGIHSPLDAAGKKMGFLSSMMEKQGEAVRRLGRYYVSFFAITSTIQQFTEAMRQAVAMQDQMLELKKFLPEGSNIGGLRQNAYSMAAEFGVPIDTVLGSFTEFAKQGKQANEILDLTRSALLGVNVASTDFATTVTYLTTVTNVWKDQFSDTSVLIDKLALVQAKSSASSEVLISAMQRSGSMAKTMGVSLDQLFGYISAVSEKTQLSGEVIGTSLKTILERAQRMKTLNLLQGMEEFKNVSFVSMTGDIMGAPQILETVAKKWGTLTDVQRKFIGEQMAGSRQLNAFTALMENMGRAAELTRDSMNSLGFAQKANESEMAKFSKSFQRFSSSMYELSSSVLTPVISGLTGVLNIVTQMTAAFPGAMKAMSGAMTGFLAVAGLSSLMKSFGMSAATSFLRVLVAAGQMAKGIISTSIAMLTLTKTTESTSSRFSFFARDISNITRGFTSMRNAATFTAGAVRLLSGALNIFSAIASLAAIGAMAWSAWSSNTESAAEKQKELNDKISESIDLMTKLSEANTKQVRLEKSRQLAKSLGSEGMRGLRTEEDPDSFMQIPAFTRREDIRYNLQVQTGKATELGPNTTNVSQNIVDIAAVLKDAEGTLKTLTGRTIEDQAEIVRTLVSARSVLGDARYAAKTPQEQMELKRQDMVAASKRAIEAGLDASNYEKEALRLNRIVSAKLPTEFFQKLEKVGQKDLEKIASAEDPSLRIATIKKSASGLDEKAVVSNIREEREKESKILQTNLEYVRKIAEVETEIRQRRMTTKTAASDDYLAKYALANEELLKLDKERINLSKQLADEERTNKDTTDVKGKIEDVKNLIVSWKAYKEEINRTGIEYSTLGRAINSLSANVRGELNSAIDTGSKSLDTLSAKIFNLSGKTFTIRFAVEAFLRSMLPSWLSKMLFGDLGEGGATNPKEQLEKSLKGYASEYKDAGNLKKEYSQILAPQAKKAVEAYESGIVWSDKKEIRDKQLRELANFKKQVSDLEYKEGGGGAAKRDRESTAHYNALERIKKAEADLQKQQQMSSYWEGKMPDKYLLKYDAETAKYKQELQAKKDALAAEGKNLKPDEVKKFKEEINVLQEKIDLQTKYRKQAEEIAAFEKWQSDNRVGMERLRTELSIKSEIYDMEYAALYSPSRADEKSYMEWKIKSAITELEAQRLIAIEEQKIVAIKNGKTEAEALSIAMSTEEVQLLDIKLQKEQQMLGLVDRQLELKKQQRINEQVREVQGMISTGIFDALSMKSKNERKKQLAEIAKELSNLSEDSNTAAYGIAQAESVGNIDAINASRDKWNEVNRQIEEARKKMDEVNNSTNKWKEVLENIGDSVLKKLADKFAEMLINKTGLGDMLGMVFGGIDGINTGGKGIKGQALPAAGSALAALSLKSPQQSMKMAQEMMGLMVPGSSGSTNYNVSVAGGGGAGVSGLASLFTGGFGSKNAISQAQKAAAAGTTTAASSAKKYGTSQYLTSAMLGYAIGSSTSNRTVGVLGGAAAGFLTGGPIGALIGGIASLFGRKKGGDEAPPVQPAREYYALFKNTDAIDRNTNTLLKLSEGVWNAPSTFEMNKLQAERNATTINNNITINATGGSAKAIAAEVNAVISNSYQSSMGKMATSTSNWG